MTKFFVNCTNHPTSKWSSDQYSAAAKLAETVFDIPFPNIPATADDDEIEAIVNNTAAQILDVDPENRSIICHIAGEPVVTHRIVSALSALGIHCVASTTERNVVETTNPDGTTTKTVQFRFVQFRNYETSAY